MVFWFVNKPLLSYCYLLSLTGRYSKHEYFQQSVALVHVSKHSSVPIHPREEMKVPLESWEVALSSTPINSIYDFTSRWLKMTGRVTYVIIVYECIAKIIRIPCICSTHFCGHIAYRSSTLKQEITLHIVDSKLSEIIYEIQLIVLPVPLPRVQLWSFWKEKYGKKRFFLA